MSNCFSGFGDFRGRDRDRDCDPRPHCRSRRDDDDRCRPTKRRHHRQHSCR